MNFKAREVMAYCFIWLSQQGAALQEVTAPSKPTISKH